MNDRIVTVSLDPKPDNYGGIWIQATYVNVVNCILTAIRMEPDRLVITKDCFGLFTVKCW